MKKEQLEKGEERKDQVPGHAARCYVVCGQASKCQEENKIISTFILTFISTKAT